MQSWRAQTPDGRAVRVWRRGEIWHARCGNSEATSWPLHVALMEAIRADSEVVTDDHPGALPRWARRQAALIEDTFVASEKADPPTA